MKHEVSLGWKEKMQFESEIAGHKITIDAKEEFGGSNAGPSPKPLILTSLSGCSAMDVISILRKMKVEPKFFNIIASGELLDETPSYYNKINLTYQFKKIDEEYLDKIEKAVKLSQDKYCGVSAMLRFAAEITYNIEFID